MDFLSFLDLVGKGSVTQGFLSGAGEEFNKQQEQRNNIPLLNPAFYGQNNASGSNAVLDKSLGESARKVAGVSEGGATPQTRNDIFGSIGNSILDWLKGLGRKES